MPKAGGDVLDRVLGQRVVIAAQKRVGVADVELVLAATPLAKARLAQPSSDGSVEFAGSASRASSSRRKASAASAAAATATSAHAATPPPAT